MNTPHFYFVVGGNTRTVYQYQVINGKVYYRPIDPHHTHTWTDSIWSLQQLLKHPYLTNACGAYKQLQKNHMHQNLSRVEGGLRGLLRKP